MDLGSERFGLSTTHQRSHHDGRRIAGRPQGYPVMTQVTHRTALVVIPPGPAWPPIQAIRAEHDHKVGRWTPYITLVYPVLPAGEFERAAGRLAPACAALPPFEVRLAR